MKAATARLWIPTAWKPTKKDAAFELGRLTVSAQASRMYQPSKLAAMLARHQTLDHDEPDAGNEERNRKNVAEGRGVVNSVFWVDGYPVSVRTDLGREETALEVETAEFRARTIGPHEVRS